MMLARSGRSVPGGLVGPLWLLVGLAGCSQTTPPQGGVDPLFDGGDGLLISEERVLRGEITQDMRLDAKEPWILDGVVIVGPQGGVELTIDPGTIIYGNPATRGTLVIARGSRIIADGTAAQPIVFTSPRTPGARRAGDWGGLALNGYAPVNGCGGVCEREGEGGSGLYGGDDPDDDSGILRYVRIEFAGALYNIQDELNGLALQGVGRGTTVDYVQLHVAADDGIEFFGGTVDVRHVLVTGANDDSFDWTGGWSGRAQYVVIQQHEGSGDRGIEADNHSDDTLYDSTPRSDPMIANLTAIGQEGSGTGFNFRRGTGVTLVDSIVTGFSTCVDIDDDATWAYAYSGGLPTEVVSGTWLDCDAIGSSSSWSTFVGKSQVTVTMDDLLMTDSVGNVADDPLLEDPLDTTNPDFAPQAASGVLSGAVGIDDPFFEVVGFAGAIGPDDWTAGWTQVGTD